MPHWIRGTEILQAAIGADRLLTGKRLAIVDFRGGTTSLARSWASNISTNAKARAFRATGAEVDVYVIDAEGEWHILAHLLERLSNALEVLGVVVQLPIPLGFRKALGALVAEKDLDAVTPGAREAGEICAAAAAVLRVVGEFGMSGPVAIVGSHGFVGSAVASSLEAFGRTVIRLDKGDSLAAVRSAGTIVSATGIPHLLGEYHIGPAQYLVVDVGFTPLRVEPLVVAGDVAPWAYSTDTYATPVPGGIGPLQIVVLLERALRLRQQRFGSEN